MGDGMVRILLAGRADDKAAEEATALGLTSPALKQFAIDYSQAHKR